MSKRENGFGCIVCLGKNRKNPYGARVTRGFSKDGKQIFEYIGYFKTRTEASKALSAEVTNPTSPKTKMSLEQLFSEWAEYYYKDISKHTRDNYNAAWNYLSVYKNVKVSEMKTAQFQNVIDTCGKGTSTKQKIKALSNLLCKYAMQNDITHKNYAEFVKVRQTEKKEKEIFTDLEIKKIEELADTIDGLECILMMIYTGFRITEFLELTRFSVDLKNKTLTGGLKTEAGKGRTVPIHPKIEKYIMAYYERCGDTLICKPNGTKYTTRHFRDYVYAPALKAAGIPHRNPHSTRHTFASMLDRANVKASDMQKLLGHTKYEFTVDTYVHKSTEELKKAVLSI